MLADTVPLYPLYALLFAETGLSATEISALFIIWSAVGLIAEVPSGALADRYSRRSALVAAGVSQASGYALWVTLPGFPAFAAGFVLWGSGGALASGSLAALLYDGLAAEGAAAHYPRIRGRLGAAELVAQVPAALAATVLFPAGGYQLVGWVSVGTCLGAAALATRFPEPPRTAQDTEASGGYRAILREGVTEAARSPAVRVAVVAFASLSGLDGIEEYFTLLAGQWGVEVAMIPIATLGIPAAGALGAATAGRAAGLRARTLASLLGAGVLIFAGAALLRLPAGLAGIGCFYAVYRMVLVLVDARLQDRITGSARATVTSVAGLGEGLAAILLYAAWALGGLWLVLALSLLLAAGLPRWLRSPPSGSPAW